MNLSRRSMHLARLAAATLTLSGLVGAQEQGRPEPEPEEAPEIVIPDLGGGTDPQQEMVRIFHEVERTLESIDVELFDAGAGRIPPPEGRDSGLDRLLRSNGSKSDQAVAGIERILEIAEQMGGKGGT